MEIVILICLLIIIVLLLYDKIVIKVLPRKPFHAEQGTTVLPEIMGKPKPAQRLVVPTSASKGQNEKRLNEDDTFDSETRKERFAIEIPQEELDDVFGNVPDLDEEEEEWRQYGDPNGDDGFATGVTFEELSTVGQVLRQELPDPALEERAVGIVQRIQGTELLSLLESSMENASPKIARLLSESISRQTGYGSSTMRDKGLGDFNIGEFV